jgi:hypothetical protein
MKKLITITLAITLLFSCSKTPLTTATGATPCDFSINGIKYKSVQQYAQIWSKGAQIVLASENTGVNDYGSIVIQLDTTKNLSHVFMVSQRINGTNIYLKPYRMGAGYGYIYKTNANINNTGLNISFNDSLQVWTSDTDPNATKVSITFNGTVNYK